MRFFASADDIEPVATTWVSGDGTYAAVGLPVGDYIVQFVGGSGLQSEYWDDVRTAAEATRVTVLAGQSTSSIDAQLYVLDVQPGTYVLQFTSYDGGVVGEYWDDAINEADATPITVASGEQVLGIDAQLASAAMITGAIRLDSAVSHDQIWRRTRRAVTSSEWPTPAVPTAATRSPFLPEPTR